MDQLPVNPSSPPATRKTVLFGDFSKYVVRRVTPIIQRLEERFIDFGQYSYIMHQRLDGNLIDGSGGAVKYLANIY
jgi:HK97 family phage major capsid protein